MARCPTLQPKRMTCSRGRFVDGNELCLVKAGQNVESARLRGRTVLRADKTAYLKGRHLTN